jgi:hypothetical protein
MHAVIMLSEDARRTAGILLLTIVAIEFGGGLMLAIVRGRQRVTDFQASFFRAGHAHAGVLAILALVCQILLDAADMNGAFEVAARNGVPTAAILMPAGFFLSAAGSDITRPNRFVVLLYAGAISLTVGVVTLGIGLLTS